MTAGERRRVGRGSKGGGGRGHLAVLGCEQGLDKGDAARAGLHDARREADVVLEDLVKVGPWCGGGVLGRGEGRGAPAAVPSGGAAKQPGQGSGYCRVRGRVRVRVPVRFGSRLGLGLGLGLE
jgi:hypothetical protein